MFTPHDWTKTRSYIRESLWESRIFHKRLGGRSVSIEASGREIKLSAPTGEIVYRCRDDGKADRAATGTIPPIMALIDRELRERMPELF